MATSFSAEYLREVARIIDDLDLAAIDRCIELIAQTRDRRGRVFVLGNGGSAANASHAVNDLRKLANIEAYAPTDNVAELTARTNDDSWMSTFSGWLKVSHLSFEDLILVLSVGGGSCDVSPNLRAALIYAKRVNARIIGITGSKGGSTARMADACILIPTVNPAHVTPHAEALQAILWHLFVNHPRLKTC